ncbi:hypothetical protein KO481_28215 [Nocardia sp. NEAU-G5]|uniref:ESAT-6-like protein n=1 Tax=Nocardia albiluteola TaxID=2842303 RepID=A0ABS6B6L5_9NOCA|nr:hypothetical protein [Nocardia albiluteola]MBU3065400.1 hypothetical protein [Nocardia albiluteola]
MSGVLKYDDNTVNNLVGDLSGYNKSLTTEMQNAQDAANNLLSQGWDSGNDNGASATFQAKHKSLMADMEGLINILSKGTQHVTDSLTRARSTDTKVAGDFTW